MATVDEKGLPANIEAEQCVLGGILAGSDWTLVRPLLDGGDFALESHRRIWAAMEQCHEHGYEINRATVANELKRGGHLESIAGTVCGDSLGPVSYLVALGDSLPRLSSLDGFVHSVKDASTRRRVIFTCQKVIDDCLLASEMPAELIQRGEQLLRNIGDQGTRKPTLKDFGQIITEIGGLDALTESKAPGIDTPWSSLNRLLGGLRPGQLILIAARPGVGKTASAGQIAVGAAEHGHGVVWFSLEMSGRELLLRTAAGLAQVDSVAVRRGQLIESERREFSRSATHLAGLPLWIDDSTNTTVPSISAALRRHMRQHRVRLAIVDYLQLCDVVGRAENRVQAVSQISRGLKLMARELEIPVVALSQLSRANENEKREPALSDLRDCGSLEQDADVVLFWHPTVQPGRPEGAPIPTKLIIAKQRAGKARRYLDFLFVENRCQFLELERKEAAA